MLNVWYIYLHLPYKFQPNVGKYGMHWFYGIYKQLPQNLGGPGDYPLDLGASISTEFRELKKWKEPGPSKRCQMDGSWGAIFRSPLRVFEHHPLEGAGMFLFKCILEIS